MSKKREILTMIDWVAEKKQLDPASFTNLMMNMWFDEDDDEFDDDDDMWFDEE